MKIDLITNNAEKQSGFIYGNTNINDEYYTPNYAITPILRYLKPNSIVWCPFDTDKSNYVKMLRKKPQRHKGYNLCIRQTKKSRTSRNGHS